jgi:glycosyltransferase involved in cell wall biosynthesis
LPYVLLEAALAELPIVASDIPGNHDIISSGENGLLITPTPDVLATSLQMLISDSGMRRQYGEAAKRLVLNKFSLETMLSQTFSVYSGSNTKSV